MINDLDPLIFLCFKHDIETAIFGKVLSSKLNLIISEPAQPVVQPMLLIRRNGTCGRKDASGFSCHRLVGICACCYITTELIIREQQETSKWRSARAGGKIDVLRIVVIPPTMGHLWSNGVYFRHSD